MIEETTSSCLVLDSGSLLTRVGFSGEEAPREIVYTDPISMESTDIFKNKSTNLNQ